MKYSMVRRVMMRVTWNMVSLKKIEEEDESEDHIT